VTHITGDEDKRETPERLDEAAAAAGRHVPPPEVPAPEAPREHEWRYGTPVHGSPARPGGPAGPPPAPPAAGPTLKAAEPGQPFYLPQADWRWPATVAGFAAAMAPQALLEVLNLLAGTTSSAAGKVTAASAILTAVASLVIYAWNAIAAWLFSLRTAGRSLVLWGFRRPNRSYFWVVPLGLGATYAIEVVHDYLVHPHQQAIVSDFPHSAVGVAMFALVAIVVAPLFEEILFRGFLFRGLSNSFGWVWGAVLSAAVFGAAHLQLDVFLPLAALGFILAWAYHRTGSLWTNITMHALFNTVAVLVWALMS
jgi:membrane protease YdiL (CAAX protease family)